MATPSKASRSGGRDVMAAIAPPPVSGVRTLLIALLFAVILVVHIAGMGYVFVATLFPPSEAASVGVLADSKDRPPCGTPFGALLGTALDTVHGFSNCNTDHISYEPAAVAVADAASSAALLSQHGVWRAAEGGAGAAADTTATATAGAAPAGELQTGMRWQCVEFARRALLLTRGVAFGSVEGAEDIWALHGVFDPREAAAAAAAAAAGGPAGAKYRTVPWIRYANNASISTAEEEAGEAKEDGEAGAVEEAELAAPSPPRKGDLLVYPRQSPDMPFGHVAVVVAFLPVGPDDIGAGGPGAAAAAAGDRRAATAVVRVAEQNYDSGAVWPAAGFTRELLWLPPTTVRRMAAPAPGDGAPAAAAGSAAAVECLRDPAGYRIAGWARVPAAAAAAAAAPPRGL